MDWVYYFKDVVAHRAEVGARRGRVVRPEGAFALGGPEGQTLDPAGAEAGRVDEPQRGGDRGAPDSSSGPNDPHLPAGFHTCAPAPASTARR